MKNQVYLAAILCLIVGCGSKKMKSENAGLTMPVADVIKKENGQVVFKKNYQELATLDINDTESGISAVIKTSNLGSGRYVLKIVEACSPPARAKNELPKKTLMTDLGDFVVKTGFTVAEFSKPGLSIGDRHILIGGKSVRLYKKNKKGNLITVACSKIKVI